MDTLTLPKMQQLSFGNLAAPAKLGLIVIILAAVLSILGQYSVMRESGATSEVKMRSWGKFIFGWLFGGLLLIINLVATNVLFYSGWVLFAWLLAILPVLFIASSIFVINTADTAIEVSNPSRNLRDLIMSFYKARLLRRIIQSEENE